MTVTRSSAMFEDIVVSGTETTKGVYDIVVPLGDNFSVRMGDAIGVNKVSFLDSANAEVGSVNSDGVASFLGGLGTIAGMITFNPGAAVTAGSYQIGRNVDTPNLTQFNVPTGASWEFSVNDVAITTLSTAGVFNTGAGTALLPAYSFVGDPDTGFYSIGANNIGLTLNGVKVVDFGTSVTTFASDISVTGGQTTRDISMKRITFLPIVEPIPPSAAQVTTDVGNLDDGTYYYSVTYYDTIGETSQSMASNLITVDAAHKQVLLTIPVSSETVTGRRIYRTKKNPANTAANFYLLATIPNNTETTYQDNIADVTLPNGDYRVKGNTTAGKIFWNSDAIGRFSDKNITLGYLAGVSLTGGGLNTFIGSRAGTAATFASYNLCIGENAGSGLISGTHNAFIGTYAGYQTTTGAHNVAIGAFALGGNVAGNFSTGYGMSAGRYSTGDYNIFFGYSSGYLPNGVIANATTTGANNTYIGAGTGQATATQVNNTVALGKNAVVTADNQFALGGTGADAVKVGINNNNPIHYLDVVGDGKFTGDLIVGANKVVMTASNGNITAGNIVSYNGFTIAPTATGTLLDAQLETEWTTGTIFNADFASATTLTGAVSGILLDFQTNLIATGYNIDPGFGIVLPAVTNTAVGNFDYVGFAVDGGALNNTNAGGATHWKGLYIELPNMTQTAGITDSYGIKLEGGTITSGTQKLIYGTITQPIASIPSVDISTTLGANVDGVIGIKSSIIGFVTGHTSGYYSAAFEASLIGDNNDTSHNYGAFYAANFTSSGGTSTAVGFIVGTGYKEALTAYSGELSFFDYTPTVISDWSGSTITAATEAPNMVFGATTKTWAAGAGPLAEQREWQFLSSTLNGNAGGALTITDAATVYIDAGPSEGANITLSNRWALWVGAYSRFDGMIDIRNTSNAIQITQEASDMGQPVVINVAGGAHTGITAASECNDIRFDFNQTKTWAAGAGPLAAQRAIKIEAPTYAGTAGGALTITDAATVYIDAAPTQGANMTLTNAYALWVDAGKVRLDGACVFGSSTVRSGITATTGAGAVAITGSSHEITTTGAADALTLANGTAGQRLSIVYVAETAGADTAVLTPTTLAGGTTITFNALGDSAYLEYHTTGGWYMMGGTATIA